MLALILAAGSAMAWSAPAFAHFSQNPPAASPPDFDQAEIPLNPVAGNIQFRADRAWTWSEGRTQRLVLERDVRVDLGGASFQADRAVVWLRSLSGPGTEPIYQVFAYLEHVRTPWADAAVSIEAEELPVRAVVRASPTLAVDLRLDGPPKSDGPIAPEPKTLDAIAAAEESLRDAVGPAIATPAPEGEAPANPSEPAEPKPQPPEEPKPLPPEEPKPSANEAEPSTPPPGQTQEPAPTGQTPPTREPIFRSDGIFYIAAGEHVTVQGGEYDNAVVITGGLVVQYQRGNDSMEITADRGVVFLKPGKLTEQLSRFSADDVIGLYLEGAVRATNGQYTLRGPRVYYDVASDRALILDAVFWTSEQRFGMPLYLRADAIRQEAANQFSAKHATLSNTAFFKPDFSIGVSSVTLTQRPNAQGGSHTVMDARNITLRAGDVPFFWWPRYNGDPQRIPIRNLGYQDSNRTGGVIRTKWDAFTLLGVQPLKNVDALIEADFYTDRGLGIGLDSDWKTATSSGGLYAYVLPSDDGTDIVARNTEIERNSEDRSLLFFRHREELPDNWTLLAEAAYVSDEAFIPALFPDIARESRELTTRLHASRRDENTLLWMEAQGALNDFIIPEHQQQTPGYMVDKLPEIGYTEIARDLLPETYPGLLTYTWEASYAQMRMRFSEVTASSLGFDTDRSAQQAFGIDADESLGDLFRSMGLNETMVNRFDTRHEISAQLKAGELLITPFAVGRLTYYDDAFAAFSPDERDHARLWGGAGVTIATSFNHINRNAESELFDIHEIRHIIEPSITVFDAETTIDREDLPIFDDDIEPLLDGTSVQLRLANTWQTKRGGPGRWRSVDLFTLNAEYVWHSQDAGPGTPIGRYYAARPELSVPGEYFRLDSTLQLTEALALGGETIYDLDINQQARSSIGALIEHSPDFTTTAELRYINSQDVTYGRLGFLYKLTDKYRTAVTTTYNFDRGDFQNFNIRIYRLFTIGEFGLGVAYDNIRGETAFGLTFTPFGISDARIGTGFDEGTAVDRGFGS